MNKDSLVVCEISTFAILIFFGRSVSPRAAYIIPLICVRAIGSEREAVSILQQYELVKDSHRNTLPNMLLAVTLAIAASYSIQSKLMDYKRRAEVARVYRTDGVPKLVGIARKHGGGGAGAITERNRMVQFRKAITLDELVAAFDAAANASRPRHLFFTAWSPSRRKRE